MSEILPNFDKAIYLDGDTLIFKDLTEMFNVDMEGYCYKGFLDYPYHRKYVKEISLVDTDHYICDGVMLLNLKELRKENSVKKFEDFIAESNHKLAQLNQHDQTVINTVFADKIGILPAKFGLWNWFLFDKNHTINYGDKILISPEKYTAQEMLNARSDPSVLHCTSKPWFYVDLACISQKWWQYAEKTDIFNEIKKKYLIADGTYIISSALNPNKVLDIDSGSRNGGAKLQLWDRNDSVAQKFKITYDKDGYYTIKALCSRKLIDVPGSSNTSGTPLWQYSNNDTDAQKWYILPNNDGTYRIISKCNGMNVDVASAETKNGTNIQCYPSNGSDAQKFRFIK